MSEGSTPPVSPVPPPDMSLQQEAEARGKELLTAYYQDPKNPKRSELLADARASFQIAASEVPTGPESPPEVPQDAWKYAMSPRPTGDSMTGNSSHDAESPPFVPETDELRAIAMAPVCAPLSLGHDDPMARVPETADGYDLQGSLSQVLAVDPHFDVDAWNREAHRVRLSHHQNRNLIDAYSSEGRRLVESLAEGHVTLEQAMGEVVGRAKGIGMTAQQVLPSAQALVDLESRIRQERGLHWQAHLDSPSPAPEAPSFPGRTPMVLTVPRVPRVDPARARARQYEAIKNLVLHPGGFGQR